MFSFSSTTWSPVCFASVWEEKNPKNLSYSGDFRIQCLLLLPSQRAVLMFKTEVMSLLSGGILERGGQERAAQNGSLVSKDVGMPMAYFIEKKK